MTTKTIQIEADSNQFIGADSDATYILAEGVKRNANNSTAIRLDSTVDHSTALINGMITDANNGVEFAYGASSNTLTVGKSAFISVLDTALSMNGDNNLLTNFGTLMAGDQMYDNAILMAGNNNRVVNNGLASSLSTAINIQGDGTIVTNTGTVVGTTGVNIWGPNSDAVNRLVNTGTITGTSGIAVQGWYGKDFVSNSGWINGNVALGDSDDKYISKNGHLNGTVAGGAGNDVFIFNHSGLDIVEFGGGGYDTEKGSVSFIMANNVEEGVLTGTGNINLTGTSTGNMLYGNAGANKINGGGGTDYITGGAGNDRLTGGSESDYFVFKFHSGKDVITDFADGFDKINLSSYAGIDDFNDIKNRIVDSGDNVVIKLLDGDSITLLNMDKAHLTMDDFQF